MSFSLLEPEQEPRCECFYDEARDAMDRDDCPFHSELTDEAAGVEQLRGERKQAETLSESKKENAA